jgi:Subtilase family
VQSRPARLTPQWPRRDRRERASRRRPSLRRGWIRRRYRDRMTGSRGISVAILAMACSMFCAPAVQASRVSPLPASDYTVDSACAAPGPGRVSCLAQLLVAKTAAARARTHPVGMSVAHAITAGSASEGAEGLRPQDLRNAYFPGEAPDAPASEPQTIAIVDAYNDPEAEADLGVYDNEFHLPECTTANGCFEQVNEHGETGKPPFPATALAKAEKEATCESSSAEPSVRAAACKTIEEVDGWSLETALDIEMAHAICQNCHIVLVEADEAEEAPLEVSEDTAVGLGAGEVSNSWAGGEPLTDSEAFNHPGTVITFAAGDRGYLNWGRTKKEEELYGEKAGVNYPASSPHVIAVGGTSLELNSTHEAWKEESVWVGSGGGCSLNFKAQPWQSGVSDWSSVGCENRRAVSDIAADGDPYTGVAVYDTVPYIPLGAGLKSATVFGWTPVGGTSASTPMIAAMFALAGGSHGVQYPAQTLYSHLGSASLHDVTEGANGKCRGEYSAGCSGSMKPLSETDCGQGALICNTATGYDGPSGVGTPNGIDALKPIRQHKGGGPELPLTEECANAIFAATGKVCGTLNPNSNANAGYYFAYNKGTNCTGGKETPLEPEKAGKGIPVSGELFGLEPYTQYAYCLIATDPSGETVGAAVTFTTEPAAPRPPQTSPAIDVTSDSATLEGKLDHQPIATSWYFQYAPQFICTWEHASTTAEQQDTKPAEVDEVSAAVTGLQPGTYYHVCLVAKNRIGSTVGWERSFLTESTAPKIESISAQSTNTEATIEARTSPDAQTATCEVQYGTSDAYGSTASCKEGLGNNGERVLASAHVTGLRAATTYYYRVVVENQIGKSSPSEGQGTVTTQAAGGTGGREETSKEEKKEAKSTPGNPLTSTLVPTPAWWLPTTSPSEPEPKPPKAKPLTRAQKLAQALKGCRREKNARKRAVCRKRARSKYGASKTEKKGRKKT